jgi:hypothetical protein
MSYNNVSQAIKHCSKSIFLFPVAEEEVVRLVMRLKARLQQVMMTYLKV